MKKTAFVISAFVAALSLPLLAARPEPVEGPQAPAPITPAQAAPFLGDWTLTLQGPNGPGTFGLTVKVDADKVVGEISNEMLPAQKISNISLVDKSLLLNYSFTWEGNAVDAVVSLMPGEGDKTNAQIDFAGGAYTMTGTAAKKDKK
jgi:hypothetical protein